MIAHRTITNQKKDCRLATRQEKRHRKTERKAKEMKRKIKIGGVWLTLEDLKELESILEMQETTDKEPKGKYSYTSNSDIEYNYKIDEEYDVILEEIRR